MKGEKMKIQIKNEKKLNHSTRRDANFNTIKIGGHMKTGIILSICGALIFFGTLANAQDEGTVINTHSGTFLVVRPSKVLSTEPRFEQNGSFNQDRGYFKHYQGKVRTQKTDIAKELEKIAQDRADGDTQEFRSDYKQLHQDISEVNKDREETYQVRKDNHQDSEGSYQVSKNNQQERENTREGRIKKMHDRYHRIDALRAQEHRMYQYRHQNERLDWKENMAKQMTHWGQGGLRNFLADQHREHTGSVKQGGHGAPVSNPRTAVRN